jgi:hypothetical protein
LNKEPSNPNSKSARRHDADTHPVLARLPDVSGESPTQQRSSHRAAAGFVDYRFDMPAGAEASESRPRLRVEAPTFKRSPRHESRTRSTGQASRALPDSDPFAFPVTSLVERLAPVARFLTLFLLFTAIGTFVLSITKERPADPKREHAPSAASPAGVQQRLEPATNDPHPTIATPKAFGPLGVAASKNVEVVSKPVEIELPSETSSQDASSEPPPSLAGANGEPLPQVQTTEIPATEELADDATARLTGSIQPHDDSRAEETSKRPAVARLPAIFEPPRNAYQ